MMNNTMKAVLASSLVGLVGLVGLGGCDGGSGGGGATAFDAGPVGAFDAQPSDSGVVSLDSSQPDSSDSSLPDAATTKPLVFTSDFEATALPAEITPGTGILTPSEGYAPLGPTGNKFGAFFLRSPTGNTVKLTLTGLAAHTTVSLKFLFAAIDSLDGTGAFPAGDFFHVKLDGQTIFRQSFANATPTQVQDYVPPAGVELARHVDLGFQGPGGYYTDSAYDLGADPLFKNIAHTASTAVVELTLEGEGVQTLDDESWAIDNLQVTLGN
jgi:hypothetical protein